MLRRQADGYYVVDGHHRVSVARTLRLRDIDAWVTGPLR
jgi:ParB-like chromosome segregation protein Spo0J